MTTKEAIEYGNDLLGSQLTCEEKEFIEKAMDALEYSEKCRWHRFKNKEEYPRVFANVIIYQYYSFPRCTFGSYNGKYFEWYSQETGRMICPGSNYVNAWRYIEPTEEEE